MLSLGVPLRAPSLGLGRQRDGWWPLILGPDVCACGLHWAARSTGARHLSTIHHIDSEELLWAAAVG